MPNKFIKAVNKLMWDTDLIGSRLTLSLAEALWALLLLWPGEVFSRPPYINMVRIMNEECWGVIFLITSIIQISIVLTDKMHNIFARYFAIWNASLWVFVVGSILISVYPPPALIGGEITMAITAIWIYIRPYILAKGYHNARCRVH